MPVKSCFLLQRYICTNMCKCCRSCRW